MKDSMGVAKMNGIFIHLKYSWKMFRYFFLFLIIISVVFSITFSFSESSYYHDWYINYVTTSPAVDPEVIHLTRAGTTISYWRDFIEYMSFIIPLIVAFFISRDEGNGMNSLLIMHSKKGSLFISRLIVIIIASFIISLLAAIIFTISFYQINEIVLNQLPECLGAFLILSSYALIGTILGLLVPKREWSIIISIFLIIFLNVLSSFGISKGDTYMGNIERSLTWNEYISLYPLKWKILKFISPWGLTEMLNPLAGVPQGGINPNPIDVSLLGLMGDISLSLAWIFLLSFLSYILFLRRHRSAVKVIP